MLKNKTQTNQINANKSIAASKDRNKECDKCQILIKMKEAAKVCPTPAVPVVLFGWSWTIYEKN